VSERTVVSIDAARTPVGKYGGVLSSVRPDDLAATAVAAVVERSGIDTADIEDVVLGCVNQAGEDNRDVARMAVLLSGLPEEIGGTTINRLCGSGMDAVHYATRAILAGDGDLFVAGGVESMSRAPWVVQKPDRGFATGPRTMWDTSLGWRMTNPRLDEMGHTDSLGMTAENLAAERYAGVADQERPYDISRERQDEFALASHQKAIAAQEQGRFDAEMVPVTVKTRKGEHVVDRDEGPRPDSSLEVLAKLRPAFLEGGSVTAGNSSSLNDGASAIVLASSEYAAEHGLPVLATIRSRAVAGVPPRVMGIGPVPATAKALERAGLELSDIDLIELNEAFAAQALAVLDGLEIGADDARVNVNGGAIALGHPLGSSGSRIITTLVHEMGRRDARYGLATMCIGVGQGIATIIER
jgi:3-oxoadipyl-CoA thiolase